MKRVQWIIGFGLAISIHGAVAVVASLDSSTAQSSNAATAPGDQGIDIGLGQLGSYQNQVERKKVEAEPVPTPPEPELVQPKPEPKPVVKKIVKPPTQVKAVETIAPPKEAAQVKKPEPAPKQEEAKAVVKAPEPELETQKVASVEETTPPEKTAPQQESRASIKGTGTQNQQRSGGKMGSADPYFAELKYWLNQHKDYPAELKKDKQQGVVVLVFSILRDGSIKSARVRKSSGNPRLDQAALNTVANASPVPPLPDHFTRERLTLSMPIEYFLHTD